LKFWLLDNILGDLGQYCHQMHAEMASYQILIIILMLLLN